VKKGRNRAGVRIGSFCALLLFALPARALEPIDTDGPDFVESSEVVPKGHFQYEVDLTSVRNRRSATHRTTISTPTLLKYGAADKVELRIAPEGYVRDTPSGARQFKGSGIRPSLRSVITWDLPQDLALGLMPGIKYDSGEDGHRFTSAIFGAVLNKRFSDRIRAFVELSASQIAH